MHKKCFAFFFYRENFLISDYFNVYTTSLKKLQLSEIDHLIDFRKIVRVFSRKPIKFKSRQQAVISLP